jgi:hypothetical protein
MKQMLKALLCIFSCTLLVLSCKKENKKYLEQQQVIPAEILSRIKSEGLSTHEVRKVKDGYVVEGDIFLSDKWFKQKGAVRKLRIAETEQYKTYNLITVNGSREITISIEGFPAVYVLATDEAIARYNALGMNLTFRRVGTGGEISIINEWLGADVLGQSGGFPTADGNPPGDPIKLNVAVIGTSPLQAYAASIIAHEIGHCIGMRHTDYFNRDFSCGASSNPNEGEGGEGAINIPGTPTTEDLASWMLACIPPNGNLPFNANDIIALRYLYGNVQPIPNGVYSITAVHSGKVLDVYDASLSQGAGVIQYPWNGDNNQRWQFTFLGNGYYRIDALHSGLSMSYWRLSPFSSPKLMQLNWGGNVFQQWKVTGIQPGQFAIECRVNGLVLDVFDASLDDGVAVITFPWNGDGNQRWILTAL